MIGLNKGRTDRPSRTGRRRSYSASTWANMSANPQRAGSRNGGIGRSNARGDRERPEDQINSPLRRRQSHCSTSGRPRSATGSNPARRDLRRCIRVAVGPTQRPPGPDIARRIAHMRSKNPLTPIQLSAERLAQVPTDYPGPGNLYRLHRYDRPPGRRYRPDGWTNSPHLPACRAPVLRPEEGLAGQALVPNKAHPAIESLDLPDRALQVIGDACQFNRAVLQICWKNAAESIEGGR